MRSLLGTMIVAGFAMGLSAVSAHADSTVACPLFQATRTIVEPLPPGWTTNSQVSPLTDYKVDLSSGQQVLVCTYGSSGAMSRAAPVNENCAKIPGKRFKCVSAPPPGPSVSIVSDGPITLVDNGVADLDAGGAPDIRLRADNPFLRLLEPVNNTRLSPQGTHLPTFADCQTAPYGAGPIPQSQLPVGVWLCVKTSDGNFGRLRVANVNGIPGLPIPMTIYFDHTTWSASSGGGSQPVHSDGTIAVQQTFTLDLDEGNVPGGPAADLQFQAVTATQLFLRPMNGAQFAVGNKSDRGYDGCSAASFSPNAVPLITLPVGSYICAATNQGRVSQFQITGLTGGATKKLTLAYSTWE
ncbi:MAG: hypothetical protein WDM94_00575 [Bauldia sp.]